MDSLERHLDELIAAVEIGVAMRRAQARYFKTREQYDLREAFEWEKRFDKAARDALYNAKGNLDGAQTS